MESFEPETMNFGTEMFLQFVIKYKMKSEHFGRYDRIDELLADEA